MEVAGVVKFQVQRTNSFMTVPEDAVNKLKLKKGDKLIVKIDGDRLIVEKC